MTIAIAIVPNATATHPATPTRRTLATLGGALGVLLAVAMIVLGQHIAARYGLHRHAGLVPLALVVALYAGCGALIGALAAPANAGSDG